MSAPPLDALEIQAAARLLAEGRAPEAVRRLEALTDAAPAYAAALVLLAKAYEADARADVALATWHRAHFLVPTSPLVRRERQRLLDLQARLPAAAAPAPAFAPALPPEAAPAPPDEGPPPTPPEGFYAAPEERPKGPEEVPAVEAPEADDAPPLALTPGGELADAHLALHAEAYEPEPPATPAPGPSGAWLDAPAPGEPAPDDAEPPTGVFAAAPEPPDAGMFLAEEEPRECCGREWLNQRHQTGNRRHCRSHPDGEQHVRQC